MKMQRKGSLIFGICTLFALCVVMVGVFAIFSYNQKSALAAKIGTMSLTVPGKARSGQSLVIVTIVNAPNVTVEALRPANGSMVWQQQISHQSSTGLNWTMVEASGTVYVVRWNTSDGSVYALSAINGHILWQKQTAPIFGVAPGQNNGLLYVATSNSSNSHPVSAISALRTNDGSQVWNVPVKELLTGSLVVTANALYTATIPLSNPSASTTVLALQLSNGNTLWQRSIAGSTPYPNGLEASNQVAYVVTTAHANGTVYALNATNGAQLWRYTNNSSGIVLSPHNANGAVYVEAFSGSSCALRSNDGKQLWCYQNSNNLFPLAAANGDIYATAYQSPRYSFCALKASNATRLWCSPVDSFAPIEAGTQNTVYTATVSNSLYAFQNNNGKLLWHKVMNGSIFGLGIAE